MNRRRKGFTLMELLIVIAIIGLIAAIAAPKMEGTISDARGAMFHAHIAAIVTAVEQYKASHEGLVPLKTGSVANGIKNVDELVNNNYLQDEARYYKEDDGGQGEFLIYPITDTSAHGVVAASNIPAVKNKTIMIIARASDNNNTEFLVYYDHAVGVNGPATSTWDDVKIK